MLNIARRLAQQLCVRKAAIRHRLKKEESNRSLASKFFPGRGLDEIEVCTLSANDPLCRRINGHENVPKYFFVI